MNPHRRLTIWILAGLVAGAVLGEALYRAYAGAVPAGWITGLSLLGNTVFMGLLKMILVPLVLSSGAGAKSRQAIGTGVVGGMIGATVLAVFLVPVFFVLVRRFFPGHARHASETPQGADHV